MRSGLKAIGVSSAGCFVEIWWLFQCRGSEVRLRPRLASKRTSEPKRHWQPYDSSVPLNPKFAKVPAEQSRELRVRDTSERVTPGAVRSASLGRAPADR